MPRTRPAYPPEFRPEAAELLALVGPVDPAGRRRARGFAAVAAQLGAPDYVDWGRREGLTSDEREELRRPGMSIHELMAKPPYHVRIGVTVLVWVVLLSALLWLSFGLTVATLATDAPVRAYCEGNPRVIES